MMQWRGLQWTMNSGALLTMVDISVGPRARKLTVRQCSTTVPTCFPPKLLILTKLTALSLLILISPPPAPPPLLTPTPRPRYLNNINLTLKCLTLLQTTFQYKIQLDNRKGKDKGPDMDWISFLVFPPVFILSFLLSFYGNISHQI